MQGDPRQVTTDKLMQDLRAITADAEELLKATAGQTGERIEEIRARAEQSVLAARERLQDAVQDMNGRVQENPWTAVGIAAGIGLLAGILLARK
jgi:ElaB/YqjD/DUF883 family membrane-anchored ribosome-binding protein